MMYGFIDLDLFKYYRPLHMFPLPYKWIIGPAFYCYIKNQFIEKGETPFHRKEWFLFLPAIVYGVLRLYWFGVSISEDGSYRITKVLVDSNFFIVQEVIILSFNVILALLALRFIRTSTQQHANLTKAVSRLPWLRKFVWIFVLINSFAVIVFCADLIVHDGKETFLFIYPQLIINVGYIYWIGFIGFTKPKFLFSSFKSSSDSIGNSSEIEEKLAIAIHENEVYTNAQITLTELSSQLELNPKELSAYINEVHQMNFSVYLNFHRVAKVKQLLASEDAKKYTLVTLAEEAGFSSKSSFNASFKKVVGMTPSAYRKQLQH
jgi:AraC-like DNA-binding protein